MKLYFDALKIILKVSLTILLFLTLPLVVFTLITSKTEVLGVQSYVVLTGSMSPAIPMGSIIYTRPANEYKVDDVVVFKQGNVTVTHRIVSLEDREGKLFYQTKGDANNVLDSEAILQKDILGKAILKANHIGTLVMYLKTPYGFISLIIFPALTLIALEFWSIKKELENRVREKVLEEILEQNVTV